MRLTIQSPAGIEAEAGNIEVLRTVLADGKPLTILPRHAPLIGEIGEGPITTKKGGIERQYAVRSGILMVANDEIRILTSGMQAEGEANA